LGYLYSSRMSLLGRSAALLLQICVALVSCPPSPSLFPYTPLFRSQELAALLESLVSNWPVPVQRLILVGHSMGGLLIRSACHYGDRKSTRLNSSHVKISYAVFCLKKKNNGAEVYSVLNI